MYYVLPWVYKAQLVNGEAKNFQYDIETMNEKLKPHGIEIKALADGFSSVGKNVILDKDGVLHNAMDIDAIEYALAA